MRNNAAMISQAFNQQNGSSAAPAIDAQMRFWFNPGHDSDQYIGPAVFAVGLALFPPLLVALAMSREGEQKTILQVYVASISRARIPAGEDPRVHDRCGGGVGFDARARDTDVWDLVQRRPDAVSDQLVSLSVLQCLLWRDGGRVDSEPGGCDSGGAERLFSAFVSAVGICVSDLEHSVVAALDF